MYYVNNKWYMSGYVVCVFNVVALLNDIKCDFYNYN